MTFYAFLAKGMTTPSEKVNIRESLWQLKAYQTWDRFSLGTDQSRGMELIKQVLKLVFVANGQQTSELLCFTKEITTVLINILRITE